MIFPLQSFSVTQRSAIHVNFCAWMNRSPDPLAGAWTGQAFHAERKGVSREPA